MALLEPIVVAGLEPPFLPSVAVEEDAAAAAAAAVAPLGILEKLEALERLLADGDDKAGTKGKGGASSVFDVRSRAGRSSRGAFCGELILGVKEG